MDLEGDLLLREINNYFRTRKGSIGGTKNYFNSGLYEFYGNIFGPTVYTEEKTHNFIGVDKEGSIYDEIYYPFDDINRVGTIIPKMFLESNLEVTKPSIEWKSVAEKGYCVLEGIEISDELSQQALDEAFIPHGLNPELNMSKSIYHAYFATLADYKKPEDHKVPNYMKEITCECLKQIPGLPSFMNGAALNTVDIVKYIYDETDLDSKLGPYSFHMDYFSRLYFMFFTYFSKKTPVIGRELLVGQREDFLDFSREALDLSPAEQPSVSNPFEKIDDDRISTFDEIKISNNTCILMNTLNPMFVHRVNKLKEKNEVVLLTHYLWSHMWPQEE